MIAMRNLGLVLGLALGVGLIGCTPSGATSATPTPSTVEATKEPPKADQAAPVEIKPDAKYTHDGFRYSGVGYTKPLTYSYQQGDSEATEGTQTMQLTGQTEKGLEAKRTRGGALSQLGEDTMLVNEKGVMVTSQSLGKLDKPSLEFPADVKPGKTWKEDSTFEQNGQLIKQSATYTVLPFQKLTVPAGTFETLPVKLTGVMSLGSDQYNLTAEGWYVKDLGMVKLVMSTQKKKEAKQVVTIVLKAK